MDPADPLALGLDPEPDVRIKSRLATLLVQKGAVIDHKVPLILVFSSLQGTNLCFCQDSHGKTPLYRACAKGNADVALVLLKHGADPNARNNFGNLPIHAAIRNGTISAVVTGRFGWMTDAFYRT